jgi:RNA polymerase sigma factor (sigma-70 family)
LSGDSGKARVSAQDWERLYRRYFPKLGGYFASQGLDPGEAEDLAHDVFQELGRAKVPEDPNTYIYAIARNMLAKHRQRKITEHTVLGEYCRRVIADNGPSHVLDAVSKEAPITGAEHILRTVIARLPPRDGELVTLRFIQGLSVKRVARRMRCSEDAIRKRIERLRAVLRRLCRE